MRNPPKIKGFTLKKKTLMALLILQAGFSSWSGASDISSKECAVTAETGLVGYDSKERPFTELYIVSAKGDGCPGNNQNVVYRASQHFPVKEFKAEVHQGTAMTPSGEASNFLSWTKITDLFGEKISGLNEFTTAMPAAGACVQEGGAIGSGQRSEIFCCERLNPTSRFLHEGICEYLIGGAVCIACGDGICNSDMREDRCNCPEDCQNKI